MSLAALDLDRLDYRRTMADEKSLASRAAVEAARATIEVKPQNAERVYSQLDVLWYSLPPLEDVSSNDCSIMHDPMLSYAGLWCAMIASE